MTKLKLYALALTAERHENQVKRTTTKAGACLARNEDEAVGRGITRAKELWPSEESWFGHAAAATEIPAWLIDTIHLHLQEVTNE